MHSFPWTDPLQTSVSKENIIFITTHIHNFIKHLSARNFKVLCKYWDCKHTSVVREYFICILFLLATAVQAKLIVLTKFHQYHETTGSSARFLSMHFPYLRWQLYIRKSLYSKSENLTLDVLLKALVRPCEFSFSLLCLNPTRPHSLRKYIYKL